MVKINKKDCRRRNYFIERKFQSRFILKFCGLVVMGGLLTIGILYFWVIHSTTVAIVHSRVQVKTTADFILPVLIQTVIVVTIIVSLAAIIVTLFISHRISGPLYRFKKVMQILGEGDFSDDFKIRLLDQLQDLANTFDSMIKKIRIELKALKENLSYLTEKLGVISEDEVSEQKRPYLSELKRVSERLNKIISYFKT